MTNSNWDEIYRPIDQEEWNTRLGFFLTNLSNLLSDSDYVVKFRGEEITKIDHITQVITTANSCGTGKDWHLNYEYMRKNYVPVELNFLMLSRFTAGCCDIWKKQEDLEWMYEG